MMVWLLKVGTLAFEEFRLSEQQEERARSRAEDRKEKERERQQR